MWLDYAEDQAKRREKREAIESIAKRKD